MDFGELSRAEDGRWTAEWVRFALAGGCVKMGKGKHVFFVKTVHSRANSCIGGEGAAWVGCVGGADEDGMLVAVGVATFPPVGCSRRSNATLAYVSTLF